MHPLSRRGAAALLVAVLTACSQGGRQVDPSVPHPGGEPRVVDWEDPSRAVMLDGGWRVAACPGDAPVLCVERDGTTVGVVETARYPVGSFDRLDLEAGPEPILASFAEGFGTAFTEDRAAGCGPGYRLQLHPVEPFSLGGMPGVSFGFTGTMADGSPSELNLQYATLDGEDIVSIVAAAYDEGGCPGKDDLVSFDSGTLEELRPHLEALLRETPLPG